MIQEPKKSHIIVRKAILTDVRFVKEAAAAINYAYRSEDGWTTEKDLVSGVRCSEDDLIQFIQESGRVSTLFFAFEGNTETVVGTIQIHSNKDHPKDAKVALFSVSPSYQSRGIGGKLIRAAMEEMKNLGFEYATLQVLENRPEILNWYKKLGFIEMGEPVPFVRPDLLIMKDLRLLNLKKPL
ncbi:acyl-CoA N-acyltransferase, partial [Backusella circina FSU 941]